MTGTYHHIVKQCFIYTYKIKYQPDMWSWVSLVFSCNYLEPIVLGKGRAIPMKCHTGQSCVIHWKNKAQIKFFFWHFTFYCFKLYVCMYMCMGAHECVFSGQLLRVCSCLQLHWLRVSLLVRPPCTLQAS